MGLHHRLRLPSIVRPVHPLLWFACLAAVMLVGACTDEAGGVEEAGTGEGGAIEFTEAVRDVAAVASPSVVQVVNQQAPGGGQPFGGADVPDLVPAGVGSGFVIDEEGRILTNNHVIEGAEQVLVRFADGREFDAEVVGRDPRTDLAVLDIEADDVPVARLGSSAELEVGDWVVAIGNALGLVGGPTVTSGVVSAVGRTVQQPPDGGGAFLFDAVQTDAAINPGNSGGPLLNLDAEVIGINTLGSGMTAGIPIQGISFAIAIDTALPLAQEIIETGRVAHPYLGISYLPLNPAIANQLGTPVARGVLIRAVEPASPAEAAGLQADDIIVEVGGEPIEGESDLPGAFNRLGPGDEVSLTVLRGGDTIEVAATLEEFPASGGE